MDNPNQYIGRFVPKYPEKYRGKVDGIIFRSLWELRMMKMLDEDERVLNWASEEMHLYYLSPKDGFQHRYFPDFIAEFQMPDGTRTIKMLEVKPSKELVPPKPPKKNKVTKRFLKECLNYEVVQAKKLAAEDYCKARGWEYVFITEHDLFPKRGA